MLISQLIDCVLQELVLEHLLDSDTFFFAFNEHSGKEVVKLGRYCYFFWKEDALFKFLENSKDLAGGPGMFFEEHEIEGDAQWPDISLVGVFILAEDLGAHKLISSRKGGAFFIKVMLIDDLGNPEVWYLHIAPMN